MPVSGFLTLSASLLLSAHGIRGHVAQKNRNSSAILRKIFSIAPDPGTKGGKLMRSVNRLKYVGISVIFAVILAFVFDRNIWKLYNGGGDLQNALDGMFSLLMTLTFAIMGVFLVVHVLHPHFGKRPVPASLKDAVGDQSVTENMSREELLGFIKELESDEEIKAYMETIGVKSDIALTLGIALLAFFFGMYGYMTSYTIGFEGSPNLLPISLCFFYIISSNVYMILKTMNVVWDV